MKTTLITFVLLIPLAVFAQGPIPGTPPFGSFGGGPLDIVNLGNLNVNIDIPITQKTGRGAPFYYVMSYNNSIWYSSAVNGVNTWQPVPNYGWQVQTDAAYGFLSHTAVHGSCGLHQGFYWSFYNWVYHDTKGGSHPLVGATSGIDCTQSPYATSGTTNDGTGLTLNLGTGTSLDGMITTRDGRIISLPSASQPSSVDTNGNQITTDGFNYTDTLGSTALSISGNVPTVTYSFPNSSGGNSTVTAGYTSYTVQTNFGCSGIAEYLAAASLLTSLTLPDGTQYLFTYEQTPGYGSSYTTGRIASVTMPTTGEILYSYTGGSNGITCSDGSAAGLTRTLQSAPPATDGIWTYARSGNTTTVTDPAGNQTAIQFQGIYETQRDSYTGSVNPTNLLQTTYTCYNGTAYPCTSTQVSLPINRVTATNNANGFYRQADTTYNYLGMAASSKQFDFGSGAPGSLLRETDISYTLINGSAERPTDIVVKDGSGNKVAETQISYDGGSLTSTSSAPNHDYTNYSSSFTARGNPTTVSQWVTGTTFNATTNTYDDLGNLRSTTDPGGHQTTLDYTDSYSDGTNHSTQAFPTTITGPTTWNGTYSHIAKNNYYWPSAMLNQVTDQNSQVTTYTYDNMWRPLGITYPDGGQATYSYFLPSAFGGGPAAAVEHQIDSTAGNTTTDYVLLDGFGRTSRTAHRNGETANWDQVDTCYNSVGLVSFVPYGYQGNGFNNTQPKRCSSSTYAGDSFAYDALGRNTSVTHSDGTSIVATFSARAVEVQDEGNGSGVSVTHVYQQDGLGRTVSVCELAASIFGTSPMPTCGLDLAGNSNGVTTTYTYDPLGDVTQISQGALIARQMTYDGLSHLLTEKIPEAGGTTTTYSYNSDGLLTSRTRPSANQAASCIAQSNCTTSTTTYAYDELHRLRTTSYTDAQSENTPNVGLYYDSPNPSGQNLGGYNDGQLTTAWVFDKTFSTVYLGSNLAYDKMGRVAVEQQNFSDSVWRTYPVSYTYNLLGLPATMSNAEVTFTYTYNRGAELTQLTSNYVDAYHPATLFSSPHYNAGAELTSDSLGNGVNETFNYDARWRPLSFSAVKNSTTLYSLGGPGTGNIMTYAPNSGVTGANDSVNGNWAYSYDALNRIAGANQSGGTNFTFDIDRNGNRWHQNPVGQGAQASFDTTTNHITNLGVVYDAAGNIINDGNGHTYTYDAEGRITQVDGGSTASYWYDAFGRRARRIVGATGYDEVYDGGQMVTEIRQSDGMWMRSEVYAGGRHLATYNMGTTFFSHADWLGSERVRSDVNGNSAGTCSSNLYGDNYVCAGTDPSPIKYAGMEYDTETQLNHTQFRYFNPRLGVWMTPDPAGMGAASAGDPQSFNRYAYVGNGPVNFVDPVGLYRICTLMGGIENEAFFCFNFGGEMLDSQSTTDPFGPGAGLSIALPGLGGSGTIPGTCLLPGGCAGLPFPSLWQTLTGWIPQIPGCDPLNPVIAENCNGGVGNTLLGPSGPLTMGVDPIAAILQNFANEWDCTKLSRFIGTTRCIYRCASFWSPDLQGLAWPYMADIRTACPNSKVDCPYYLKMDTGGRFDSFPHYEPDGVPIVPGSCIDVLTKH